MGSHKTVAVIVLLAALAVGCDNSRPVQPSAMRAAPKVETSIEAPGTTGLDKDRHAAPTGVAAKAGSPLTYAGYRCTIDCPGHMAGYQWAEDNGIRDPEDCHGNSNSFVEGCRSYAEEKGEDASADEDDEE